MKSYQSEPEGQREFYERIGIRPDLSHNTDGVDRGNLYENKLMIDNIYKTLFQAVKYASRIRIRGERLPANIILNDLNKEVVYVFRTQDLLEDVEKVYFGAASKGNDDYITSAKYVEIDYSTSGGLMNLLEYVNSNEYVRYHIDKYNIVGLSQQFYREKPSKDDFIKGADAEIRKPTVLADRIYPYPQETNIEFEDIMDCLNPGLLQREQGAYYTPKAYVDEMHELLYRAIGELPPGMDYVIIDRCAGTGNLEEGLPDEILGHCILSTIEFNEYAILNLKYGDKCLVVIPNTDALAYDIIPAAHDGTGVKDDFIREKVEDENCAVILMENPPYSESGSGASQNTGRKENSWKKSFVIGEMRNEYKGVVLNDLSNLFIWSGFHYYLKKPHDNYILYSPTKYWRNQNLVNKQFGGGFLCNRQEFHASLCSSIGCIRWKNVTDTETEALTLTPYAIKGDAVCRADEDVVIRKAHRNLSEAYDNRSFPDDLTDGIICEKDGREFEENGRKTAVSKPLYNANIIGYIQADSFSIDRKTVKLVRGALYNGHGFYLRADNFTEKLPLFVASAFPYDKWYKTDVYSKCYDGGGSFTADKEFLKRCLIYTALTPKNKCRSFAGSDGRFYKNELCFEKEDTAAYRALIRFGADGFKPDEDEQTLLKYWGDVMFEVHKTEEYRAAVLAEPETRYGLWQIKEEINILVDSGRVDRTGAPVLMYKYPTLNTEVKKLEGAVKAYYETHLVAWLFRYELIK